MAVKLRDTRVLALLIAIAFLVLWIVSVGVTKAVPPQEPVSQPEEASLAPQLRVIGVAGWALVGAGILGVGLSVFLAGRRRHRRLSAYKRPRRYQKSVVRREQPMIRTYRAPAYRGRAGL